MKKLPTPEELLPAKAFAQNRLNANPSVYRKWAYEIISTPTKWPTTSVIAAYEVVLDEMNGNVPTNQM